MVIPVSSARLHASARKSEKSNRVFSLLDTHIRTRLVTVMVGVDDPAAAPNIFDDDDMSPRDQKSSFSTKSSSSGSTVSSTGTSLGQKPSTSRLSSTANP